jgi:hypothetical protein
MRLTDILIKRAGTHPGSKRRIGGERNFPIRLAMPQIAKKILHLIDSKEAAQRLQGNPSRSMIATSHRTNP